MICCLRGSALALIAGCEPDSAAVQAGASDARRSRRRERAVRRRQPSRSAKAFTRLNDKLRVEYERALDERGSRIVTASRAAAFDALHAGLIRLGMIVESRDPDIGIADRGGARAAAAEQPTNGAARCSRTCR